MQNIKLAKGNKKIGKDTFIINFSSATDCKSKKLGLCKLGKKCYAFKPEIRYNNPNDPSYCLGARRKNCNAINNSTAQEIANFIIAKAQSKRIKIKIKYLRFSEAGDFRSQADIVKINKIADILKPYKIKVYGYTARKDLNYKGLSDNIVINGSSFMINNSFTAVKEPRGVICKGNCRLCNICKISKGLSIQVKYH